MAAPVPPPFSGLSPLSSKKFCIPPQVAQFSEGLSPPLIMGGGGGGQLCLVLSLSISSCWKSKYTFISLDMSSKSISVKSLLQVHENAVSCYFLLSPCFQVVRLLLQTLSWFLPALHQLLRWFLACSLNKLTCC